MKQIVYLILTLLFSQFAVSQTFKKQTLSDRDKNKGVVLRFECVNEDSSAGILFLFKNDQTYDYESATHIYHSYSKGSWFRTGDIINVKSSIQSDNLPIKLSYGSEGVFEDGFRISTVANTKGEFVPAFVFINSDSVKCDPSLGICNATYGAIKRIKVVLENGISSKWIDVNNSEEKIAVTILSTEILLNYSVINSKYQLQENGSLLKKIK